MSEWVYARLTVIDGERSLKPASVCSDWIRFAESPRLTSPRLDVIVTIGAESNRYFAQVLPHEPDAKHIPIRLIDEP